MTPTIIPFETTKVKGLFVEVPMWANDFRVHKSKLWLFKGRDIIASDSIDIHEGNWQLLGLRNEVSEKQAKIVMGFDKRFCGTVPYSIVNQASLNKLARFLNVPENSVVLIEPKNQSNDTEQPN